MVSRRDFGKVMLAGLPASIAFAQKAGGVRLGVCTYSFRDLPHEQGGDATGPVISAMKECGADMCELFSPQLEPANPMTERGPRGGGAVGSGGPNGPGGPGPARDPQAMAAAMRARMNSPEAKKYREDVRQWRLNTPASHFEQVRNKFESAGIKIFAYTLNFREDFTDEELDKCFQQTKALGAKVIASSTTLSMAPRLAPLADKYGIYVALHGHSNTRDPNEFSSPETFSKAMAMSKNFRVNLDIGHFSAAGFDPVAYIQENHDKITHLHVKDRKSNDGQNAPFGEGNTPIKEVLQLLKKKRYDIPAFVEYEYRGSGTSVEEVKKCLAYMESALA
jgi:sugar phosphate isomerase/epimerase